MTHREAGRSRPSVSIVMPARNEERLILRALRSLQRQTVRDIEIVVVDDGSTDCTAELTERASLSDSRIRLLYNSGRGFVDALNHGLDRASAELVARLDADDIALRRRLELQIREMKENSALLVLGTHGVRINEAGVPVAWFRAGPVGQEGYFRARASLTPIRLIHSSVMFRRDAAMKAGGYQSGYFPADDCKLWNTLADDGHVYALSNRLILYSLRRHSISMNHLRDMYLQWFRIQKELETGHEFPSLAAFAASFQDEDIMSEKFLNSAQAQRKFMRSLVNGRVLEGYRTAKSHGITVPELWAMRPRTPKR